jgi:ATP:ADP antiporter, AAA family
MRKNLGPGVDGWAISLKAMMSIVVALGLVITGIYWGVNRFVIDKSAMPVVERKKKVGLDKRFTVLLVLFMVLFLMLL